MPDGNDFPEVRDALDELGRTFAEFRESNDRTR
jgi:hypothetical protein